VLRGASISARCPREDRAHALHALPLEAKSGTRKESKNQLDVGERQLRVAHPLRAYGVRTFLYGGMSVREPLTVDRTGRYSNRSSQVKRPPLLDLLIRCHRELADLATLVRSSEDPPSTSATGVRHHARG
jgi:hypothetical protein